MNLGDKAVDFSLKGTDGKEHSLKDFKDARALVLIFSCNHCPYVKAYEGRMVRVQADYLSKGVRLIVINSNDAAKYPEDSFDNMVARAKSEDFNFPYLQDSTQETAKAYEATHTPQLYVFDDHKRLSYTGKIDDNWEDEAAVKNRFLREALDDILAARPLRTPETHAVGCTIKWKR